MTYRLSAFIHDKTHNACFFFFKRAKIDLLELVCSAGAWVSDNAVRVLLGEGQIKNREQRVGRQTPV